jgi:hypothetical protein
LRQGGVHLFAAANPSAQRKRRQGLRLGARGNAQQGR